MNQLSQPVGSFGGRCHFSSGDWCLPITGGLLPSIGPNKYRFLLMLSVNALARAPAESLLRVYERRRQQQQRL